MITPQEFGVWKHQPITKALYEAVRALRSQLELQMVNENLILRPDGQLQLANLAGHRSGLDHILNLSIEDLND